jgi:hypothetical protein
MPYLVTQLEPGGERHYIDGVAIHAGDPIRVFHAGEWKDARYEANWVRGHITAAWAYLTHDDAFRLSPETLVELPQ